MSKKKEAPKKAKKNITPAKSKPSVKGKTAKPVNKTQAKPARPTGGKGAKPVKKVELKKVVKPVTKAVKSIKKEAKPVSKSVSKQIVKDKASAKPETVVKKTIAKVEVIITKNGKKNPKEDKIVTLAVKAGKEPDKAKPVKDKPKGKGGRKPKRKDGEDDEPEIVHDELIEQLIQSTKRKKSGPKVPKILKTFVNPMTSLTVAQPEGGKKGSSIPKKEPKGKFELEYVIRTSGSILYEFISTPSGLSEWFADDVNIRDGIFTFFWDGSEQKARLLGFKEEKFIRLSWMDKPEGCFFEFRVERDELTGDISLIIVDFADEASDMQTSKLLWDSQVNKLLGVLGSN